MSGSGRLRLHLTPAAVHAVRHGHPWVYADRVRQQNRTGDAGEVAALYDGRDRFIGLGLFDPGSPLRVRVLHAGPPVTADDAWWAQRLQSALARRAGVFGQDTNGWRWIHGESDGWPGLVLDRYADVLVMKIYTAAWLRWMEMLQGLIVRALQPRSLVVRFSRNVQPLAEAAGYADGSVLTGEPVVGPVVFLEHGLRFEAAVIQGQKTGFFLDQRENRVLVGARSSGAEVLNAFSFSGGFSLHAARGGAVSVTDLDISPHALASARRNFALNADVPAVAAARHETVTADVFAWLEGSPRRQFDLVISDPPSLARREADREGALTAYERLGRLGATRVRPGGGLLAASCSAHVTAAEFESATRRGVQRSGRRFEVERVTEHPVDHPAGFPEARYLKAMYLRVG